jgi:hypothetical protein
MATIIKRTTIALTQSDVDKLEALSRREGENWTQVLRRALFLMHYVTFKEGKKNEIK